MKRFITLAALTLIAAVAVVSCAKEQMPSTINASSSVLQEKTIGVSVLFDAPETATAEIFFLNEDNVAISSNTVLVPSTANEVVDVNIVSNGETPAFIFTPGCVNGDEMGRIAIPRQALVTKAGGAEPILIKIR